MEPIGKKVMVAVNYDEKIKHFIAKLLREEGPEGDNSSSF